MGAKPHDGLGINNANFAPRAEENGSSAGVPERSKGQDLRSCGLVPSRVRISSPAFLFLAEKTCIRKGQSPCNEIKLKFGKSEKIWQRN